MCRCLVRGSVSIDEFFHVRSIALPGETIPSTNLTHHPGGKGANQSVAVARAGGAVDFAASVGTDGVWVRENLHKNGVNVEHVYVSEVNTGRAIIQLTPEGENSIILYAGANYSTNPQHTPHKTFTSQTTHLLLQNEIPIQSTIEYLEYAYTHDVESIFNPSPMPNPKAATKDQFPWTKVTWLVVNEGEAKALYAVLAGEDTRSDNNKVEGLLKSLSTHIPTTNVICTLGAAGVVALLPAAQAGADESATVIRLPAAKLWGTTRDTTGAGDCFTGYMVAGLMALKTKVYGKEDVQAVLKRSVQAAGMCVEKHGATESIPTAAEVNVRLAAHA